LRPKLFASKELHARLFNPNEEHLMSDGVSSLAKPLSRYAPFRRAGDIVYFAGITAADPSTLKVIKGYSDLPPELRKLAGETGEMSTDMKDGPIAAQSLAMAVAEREEIHQAFSCLFRQRKRGEVGPAARIHVQCLWCLKRETRFHASSVGRRPAVRAREKHKVRLSI